MGIIPKVKCSRCEKSFSALQSKCPYCGARRSKGGKFSMPEDGDPKWRLAVGALLLVAVLCTVIALVNINKEGGGGGGGAGAGAGDTVEASPSPAVSGDANTSPSPNTSGAGDETEASASPSPSPSPSPSAESNESIESIIVKWDYYKGSNEMTIDVGFSIELKAEVNPTTAEDVEVTWTSENPGVCTVDENGKIQGVGSGKTTITAECNGVEGKLIVRVK